jgi:hypothetical protein
LALYATTLELGAWAICIGRGISAKTAAYAGSSDFVLNAAPIGSVERY